MLSILARIGLNFHLPFSFICLKSFSLSGKVRSITSPYNRFKRFTAAGVYKT
jgi:hypothetical protein